jgi:hypothetical protein
MSRKRRLALVIPLFFASSSFTLVTSACGDITGTGGDKCTKGCKCGAACIDCSKTCHMMKAYFWTGTVADSLRP